jgi:hypothetical protein
MKIKHFQDLVVPVCKTSAEKGDGFFFVHFSAEEDKYQGGEIGLDALDIGIVVKQFFHRVVKSITAKTKPGVVAYGIFNDIKNDCEDLMKQCLWDSSTEPGGNSGEKK